MWQNGNMADLENVVIADDDRVPAENEAPQEIIPQETIPQEMMPHIETDVENANLNFDRTTDYFFENVNMWRISRKERNMHSMVSVGEIKAGKYIPYGEHTAETLGTLWIKNNEKHTGQINNHVRVFEKKVTKKRLPSWRMCAGDIGLIQMTQSFFDYYQTSTKGKSIKNCYEIDENNQVTIYMMISHKKIVPTIYAMDGEGHIRNAVCSVDDQKNKCPLYRWNEVIPIMYPEYACKLISLPRQRWVESGTALEYIEDPESSSDTDDDDDEFGEYKETTKGNYQKEFMYPTRAIIYSGGDEPRSTKLDFEYFYGRVGQHRVGAPHYNLSLEQLTCNLREYQIQAVEFMIHRELSPNIKVPFDIFKTIKLDEYYYYPELGVFSRTDYQPEMQIIGGILGDEMGLGKTVEILALIFSLRKDNAEKMAAETMDPRGEIIIEPIQECVEFLVSTVAAQEEGMKGLNTILRTKYIRTETRNKNVYFNLNSRHYKKNETPVETKISCRDCGTTCDKTKMYWEFDDKLFQCPDCVFMACRDYENKYESGATLIVVPQILLHQWYEEIRKHIRNTVKIDMYMGVEKDGYKHPMYLSQCDIVLTSYEVLRHELDYTQQTTQFNLRKRKYDQQRQVTTPLIAIHWWRICLDESQVVEGWSTMAARMVGKLTARARWCVTGTPLTSGVHDLFGLVSFLNLYPFTVQQAFEALMINPFYERKRKRLYKFMAQFFWRNSTKTVKDQLNIPTLSFDTTTISFSPLEERLYQELLGQTVGRMADFVDKYPHTYEIMIVELPYDLQKEVMDLFNKLRLNILTGGSHIKTKTKTTSTGMQIVNSAAILFKRLLSTHRAKLEEKAREYALSVCAEGGLLFLYRVAQAEACYEKLKDVQQIMEEVNALFRKQSFGKDVAIDSTQMIHYCRALLDLNDIIPLKRFDSNVIRAKLISTTERYMTRESQHMLKVHEDWQRIEGDWRMFEENFSTCTSWILTTLEAMKHYQLGEFKDWMLLAEVDMAHNVLAMWESSNGQWTFPLRVFNYIYDILERQQGNLTELRRKVQGLIFDFKNATPEQVNATPELVDMMECYHNRDLLESKEEEDEEEEPILGATRSQTKQKFILEDKFSRYNCPLCELQKAANKIGKDLYFLDGDKRVDLEHGDLYVMLRELCKKYCRLYCHQQLRIFWKWFEQARKTVFLSQKCIVSMKEFICRHRELKQAETRMERGMQVSLPGFGRAEELPDKENGEIATTINFYRGQIKQLNTDIKKIFTQIKYVSTLNSEKDDEKDRQCPVCLDDLYESWNVFPCAHYVCVRCFKGLRKSCRENRSPLQCTVCRAAFNPENVVHVLNKQEKANHDVIPGFHKGQLSVKYDVIIRKLLRILDEDITNKVLIFTSLVESLDSFCNILNRVKINYNRLYTMDPVKIAKFRSDPQIRVLVISLHTGSSGLNLTQANHIFFLEPTVEKATIAQAIGRMSRMGQYRAMTVHNFVLVGSIEEEIDRLHEDVVSKEGWTIEKLESLLAGAAISHLPDENA